MDKIKPTYKELEDRVAKLESERDNTEAKQFYEDIIDGVQDGIWVTDENDTINFANKGMEKIAGIPRDQIQGKNVLQDFPEETTGELIAFYNQAKEEKKPIWYDIKVTTPAGKNTWQNGWLIPKYKDESFLGIICTIRDVSERKKAEELTLKNKNSLEYALLSIETGAWELDLETLESWRMYKHDQIFGYDKPLKDWSYDKFLEHVIPEDKAMVDEKFQFAIANSSDWNFECRIKRNDGVIRWIWANGHQETNDSKESKKMFGIVQDITNRKNAENLLLESNLKHSAMIENIGDVIGIIGVDGNTKYQSPNIEKWFGWKPEEFIGTNGWDKMHPNDVNRIQKEFSKILKSKKARTVEYRFLCKDGNYKWIELTAINRLDTPMINGVLVNYRDITEKKATETTLKESEERYRTLLESVSAGIGYYDLKGNVILFNKLAASDMNGVPEDFIGKSIFEIFGEDKGKFYFDRIQKTAKATEFLEFEDEIKLPTMTKWFVSRYGKIQNIEGVVIGVQIISHDITNLKSTEKTLIQSEAFNRKIVDNSFDCIKILDLEANLQFMSKGGQKLLEIKNIKDYIGKSWFDLFTNKDLKSVVEAVNKAKLGEVGRFKSYIPTENGKPMWWDAIVTPIVDDKGKLASLLAISRDITQQKQATEELKKSEAQIHSIIDNSTNMYYSHDIHHKLKYVSPQVIDILGYTQEEALNKWTNFISDNPLNDIGYQNTVNAIKTGKKQPIYELELVRKDKKKIIVEVRESPKLKDGKTIAIIGSLNDITERKNAEKKILETQSYLTKSQELGKTGTWKLNIQDNILIWTEENYKIFGIPPGTPLTYDIFLSRIHPEDRDFVNREWNSRTKTNDYDIEHRLLIDGKVVWVREKAEVNYDEAGNPIEAIGFTQDITDNKQAEQALKESNERFNIAFNQQFVLMAILSPEGYTVEINNLPLKVQGVKREDYIGKLFWQSPTWKNSKEWQEKIKNNVIQAASMKEPLFTEDIFFLKNGNRQNALAIYNAVRDEENNIRYILVQAMDITERKLSEDLLKESEARFKALHNATFGGIAIHDKGLILDCNHGLSEISGYSTDELIGMDGMLLIAEESREMVMANILAEHEEPYESTGIKKNGEKYSLRLEAKMIPYKGQKARVVEFRNITESKQAEIKLVQSEFRFRELVDNIGSGVAVYKVINEGLSGADYIITDFNKAALSIEGLSKEEIVGKSLIELRPNIDDYGLIPIFQKVWKTGSPIFFPAKQYTDNKYESFYENRVYKLPSGEIVAVYDDVTDRENTALEITESRQRYDLAMKAAKDGLFDWNLITNEIYYSPGWKSMLGYKDHELPNDFSVWEKLTESEHVNKSWEMQQEVINKQRDRFEMEFKMKHKDGHWIDILSRAEAIFDENDKATRIVGTHVDISQIKKTKEEINMLKNAVEDSFLGVIMATIDGTNFFMNEAAYKLFGYDSKQDSIEGSRSGIGWLYQEKYDAATQELRSKGYWKGDIIAKRKDGTRFNCYISANVINNLDGEAQHIISYYLDITDRKQAEDSVKKLNHELEQKVADRTKKLEDQNTVLARMNKIFVGRELRMVELKQTLKEMEERLTK